MPPFMSPHECPDKYAAFRNAQPVMVELRAGDMLYLPAFWYHAVQGGDGYNCVLAWWSDIHEQKHDDSAHEFQPR